MRRRSPFPARPVAAAGAAFALVAAAPRLSALVPSTNRGLAAVPPSAAVPATNAPIRDIHDVVEIPNPWRHAGVFAATGLVLAAAAAGGWLWWRARNRPPAPPVPENPADVARRRLDAARSLARDPRAFGIEVSSAVREYLERRYGLRAPDQTTEEFLADLRSRPLLEARHQAVLASFLEQCDLLKFAGARPAPGAADLLVESGRRVVDETDPGAPVPTEVAA